ncbi:MAG: MltA domain-containing protein [Candidatus Protistobacter heckmanni]|nr:MltA domain-containing protein [Candidatus Protistobacter heckmanni]
MRWPAALACAALAAAFLAGCGTPRPPLLSAEPSAPAASAQPAQPLPETVGKAGPANWDELPGWREDDLGSAWPAWMRSCEALTRRGDWSQVCAQARRVDPLDSGALRAYFEAYFQPYRLANPDGSLTGLITGYYEPVLRGSRRREGEFQTPLYRYPAAWRRAKPSPAPTRAELMQGNALAGNELVYVDDPVEAAFLQVQGSGRVQLNDGTLMRVVFAGSNDLPYQSIGRWLLDQGEITPSHSTMQGIKAWARANPGKVERMLAANPRFVFFAESLAGAELGPPGSLGVPLTPERSIAVDNGAIPAGAPVFLATTRPLSAQPLQRLMLAQDTGTAIRGTVRADFFWGHGAQAGELAGRMKQSGSMWLLLPRR